LKCINLIQDTTCNPHEDLIKNAPRNEVKVMLYLRHEWEYLGEKTFKNKRKKPLVMPCTIYEHITSILVGGCGTDGGGSIPSKAKQTFFCFLSTIHSSPKSSNQARNIMS
jgi:hypothetical protein